MTNALIEELQAGPGSRELSDKVLVALGWTNPATTLKAFSWHRPDGSLWVGGWAGPDPTRNLQDAVDLVPEGWCFSCGNDWQPDINGWARAFPRIKGQHAGTGNQYAATPELAVCIALIKARSL